MSVLKKLAGQTVIYGLSSIIARFLNFLLTPFYTNVFSPDQFGIVTEMYAYVAFLVVFLTYGMETSFFRYSTKKDLDQKSVYQNILYSVSTTSALFIVVAVLFSQSIANWLSYPDHAEYIIWFAIIVALDALSAIPFAKLRKENKAKKFAMINIYNVAINIGLNLYFLWYCKGNFDAGTSNWLIDLTYNPHIGVGYVFISNLIASIAKFMFLGSEMSFRGKFDWGLLKSILNYAYPMLFVGLAGIVNEMLDRVMLKDILTDKYMSLGMDAQSAGTKALTQLGIYGGNYKIAMIVALFLQAYRYAAEPFFFNQEKEKNSSKTYAKIMNIFMIAVALMFLSISMNLQLIKYFTTQEVYWEGLYVVPILLAANVLLGIYMNQSIWYKLSSNTGYGAILSIGGAIVTIVLNVMFIPEYGYVACAWITLITYAAMLVASYLWGQKEYPIPYNLRKTGLYLGLAGLFFLIRSRVGIYEPFSWLEFLYNNFLILLYLVIVVYFEKTLWNLVSEKLLKRK